VPRRHRRRGRRHGRRCRLEPNEGSATGRADGHGSAVGDGCAAHARLVDRPMTRPV
jgi:hypothetical protein